MEEGKLFLIQRKGRKSLKNLYSGREVYGTGTILYLLQVHCFSCCLDLHYLTFGPFEPKDIAWFLQRFG